MPVPDVIADNPVAGRARFDSIDQLRGAIMVLMALDHVRWFFTDISAYQPETLASTSPWLFLTRWVTHFCAPGFFLLAGMAIYLHGARVGNRRDLRHYLISRGVFLVLLELTVVGYAWVLTPGYSFGGVIWSLGCCFVVMALLVGVRRQVLLSGAVLFLLFHNAVLDETMSPGNPWLALLWHALYQPGFTGVPGTGASYLFLFPIIPWLVMMVLGYALGHWFRRPVDVRRRFFVRIGIAMIIVFCVLRFAGTFGNPESLWISPTTPGHFSMQPDLVSSVINFLNTEKYPPSLQFALMTLGPLLLWLGLSRIDCIDGPPNRISGALVIFGRVPLFFYLCHLYLVHTLALVITSMLGQPNDWIGFAADPSATRPGGYGFGLPVVYLAWVSATLVLYVLCRSYARYKSGHAYAWLRYL